MELTSADIFELSDRFRDLSREVGQWRTQHRSDLDERQRQDLEALEVRLLTRASELTTSAVGLVLDESEASVEQLKETTGRARDAVKTLQTIGKVINLATAAVGLAGAIASKDVGATARSAKSLYAAVTAAI